MAVQNFPLLSEAARDLVLNKLKSNFNNFLADADNLYSDGINLEPIDDTSFYISYRFQTLRPPAIYVLFENHAFQYSEAPNFLDSNDRCLVVLSCEDVDGEVLTRKSERYGRILFGCLNQEELVTQDQRLKIQVLVETLDYLQPASDKLQTEQKKFRIDVVLTLKLLHYEKLLT
jgi:hypothetical protein